MNYYPEDDPEWWKQQPSGPLAYLRASDFYFFEIVGLLLTALFSGLVAAWLVSLIGRRFRPGDGASAGRPWRFQMGLRTLMLYTLLIAIALGWIVRERQLSVKMRRAYDRMEAKDYLDGYTGRPGFFPWFNRLVWLDLPKEIYGVSFDNNAGEEDFIALANFRSLPAVSISCPWEHAPILRDDLLAHLRKVSGLRAFRLESFAYSAAGLRHLDGLPLEDLDLVFVEGFDDAEFARLVQFKHLKTLKIATSAPPDEELEDGERYPYVSDAALLHLSAFPALESLELHGIPVSNSSAAVIGSLRKLKHLSIPAGAIDDDGLAEFAALDQLELLELPGTITDHGIAHLSRIRKLKSFQTQARLTDKSLPWLAQNRELQWVALFDATITDNGAERLAELSKLHQLDIRGSDLTDRSMERIAALQELQHLIISGAGVTDEGFRHLAKLQNLQTLGVSGTGIGDESMKTAESLPRLSLLSVGRTKVSFEAMQRLEKHARSRGSFIQVSDRW